MIMDEKNENENNKKEPHEWMEWNCFWFECVGELGGIVGHMGSIH